VEIHKGYFNKSRELKKKKVVGKSKKMAQLQVRREENQKWGAGWNLCHLSTARATKTKGGDEKKLVDLQRRAERREIPGGSGKEENNAVTKRKRGKLLQKTERKGSQGEVGLAKEKIRGTTWGEVREKQRGIPPGCVEPEEGKLDSLISMDKGKTGVEGGEICLELENAHQVGGLRGGQVN